MSSAMPGSKSPVRRRRFVHATQWHALKATYFSGNTVGAYCIRPTKRHPMDGECLYTTKGRALAPLRRDVWRAYAFAPLHRDMQTRRGFHLPPHGIPKRQPIFQVTRQNTPRMRSFFGRQGRGVWHTPHKAPSHGWRMPVHDQRQGPRPPFGGSFVGRMQYAPTQRHKNAPHFPPPTPWHPPNAARFSGNTAKHAPTAIIFRPSG